jgi:hypothetical protein
MYICAQKQQEIIESAYMRFRRLLQENGISVELRDDFDKYTALRRHHGDRQLNQAFDPQHATFGSGDFWLLAENRKGEAIATYCLRRFVVNDFFDLIRSLALWFDNPANYKDPRFVVECQMPPFGGDVVHGGGLWVRDDCRGVSRLAVILPNLARIFALRQRPFDHDTAMIRNDPANTTAAIERKAKFMGTKVYGYARVHRFVDGWFPPEGRNAMMYLCHATRTEAITLLSRVTTRPAAITAGLRVREAAAHLSELSAGPPAGRPEQAAAAGGHMNRRAHFRQY